MGWNLFSEDFDADSNGWMLSTVGGGNSWQWYSDQGVNNSGGLRCKFTPAGNYVISPPININSGNEFTLVFDGKKANSSTQRIIRVYLNDSPDLNSPLDTLIEVEYESDWNTFSANFTVTSTNNYYLVFEAEGSGYVFIHLDNILIEPTVYPSISWLNPFDNDQFVQDETISLEVSAFDSDGSISKVEYYANGNLIGTSNTSPFDFEWTNVQPGNYDLTAVAFDNRSNATTSSILSIIVNQATGFADQVYYNFDSQNEFWTYEGGWTLSNNGYNNSLAAFGFNLIEEDYLASPAIEMFQNENYRLQFRLDAQGSNREITAAINTSPDLIGAIDLITLPVNADDDYLILNEVFFNVNSDGAHYIIFYNPSGTGYKKLLLDEVTLSGTHNEGALSFIEYSGSTTIAENADFNFSCDPFDNDGIVNQVSYIANSAVVASSNVSPFNATWNALPIGNYALFAEVTDNENFSSPSFPLEIQVVEENINSSFLGGINDDEIRGAVIQKDGTIILGGILSDLPSGITPINLNGSTATDKGIILRLSADGTQIISATIVGNEVVDLSIDAQDRIYVAAGSSGFLCLNADANQIVYQHNFSLNVHRVDAGSNGYAAILLDNEDDYDEIKLLDTEIRTYDSYGTELSVTGGATTYTTDVCIEILSETVISIGYKNVFTNDGTGAVLPVDIPAMKGKDYYGNLKYTAYDWSDDDNSPRWLNLPENNMADARGARCEIGDDGLLYAVFEADGGNHCFRYDPFSITLSNPIVGGDAYSEFYNSNTEPKAVIMRYNPGTGEVLKTQQFCARLSNTAANTVRTKNGNIAANALGEVFVVGRSASGIPIDLEHLPGAYQGGAYLLKLSEDFFERKKCIRLTNGDARAIALNKNGAYLFAGSTEENLYLNNAIQNNNAGGIDGWFGVEFISENCPADYADGPFINSFPSLNNTLNNNKDFETDGIINSVQKIGTINAVQVDYDSATEINLLPGFEIELGSEFDAIIDGCNNGSGGGIDN